MPVRVLILIFVVLAGFWPGQGRAAPDPNAAAFAFLDTFNDVTIPAKSILLEGQRVHGPDGKTMTIKDWRGRWIILNLWATWCPPCLEELPGLAALWRGAAGPSLDVVAVSVDSGKTVEKIKEFKAKHKAGALPTWLDADRGLQKALKPEVMPMTYLIDPRGRVVALLYGPGEWAGRGAHALARRLALEANLVDLYVKHVKLQRDKTSPKP